MDANRAFAAFRAIGSRVRTAGAWGEPAAQYARNAWKASSLTRSGLVTSAVVGGGVGAAGGTAESYYNQGRFDPRLVTRRALQGAGLGVGYGLFKGAGRAGVWKDAQKFVSTEYAIGSGNASRYKRGVRPFGPDLPYPGQIGVSPTRTSTSVGTMSAAGMPRIVPNAYRRYYPSL